MHKGGYPSPAACPKSTLNIAEEHLRDLADGVGRRKALASQLHHPLWNNHAKQ